MTNSVISSGRGMGIIIENSKNIELKNNVVADFIQHGIWVKRSSDITIEGNWVHHVPPEVDKIPVVKEYPILQPFAIGGITATQGTARITMKNNIVSGTWHHAFHFKPLNMGKDCADPDDDNNNFVFEGNIAHSISGYGAIALNV